MRFIFLLPLVLALSIGVMPSPSSAGETDPLFINLTTDDVHRAHMAITFGGKQHELGHPLTVFLNDKGVHIGSTAHSDRFAGQQKVLEELMGKGATVIICPMCMQHFGIKEADLLPGLKIGKPELTGAALFRDNTRTLTW